MMKHYTEEVTGHDAQGVRGILRIDNTSLKFLSLFKFLLFCVLPTCFICMHICVLYAYNTLRGQNWISDTLEAMLEMVASEMP